MRAQIPSGSVGEHTGSHETRSPWGQVRECLTDKVEVVFELGLDQWEDLDPQR